MLDMKSKDIVQSNVKKMEELFPTCITEQDGKKVIDFEKLKLEFKEEITDEKKEKYQLTWPGKTEAIIEANKRTNKTLKPVMEKSVDFDTTENIYIEGDNLEVLKILQESYANKIKCIYIDPPYNTGKDFIYSDKFSKNVTDELVSSGQIDEMGNKYVQNPESNGRYHSDWLSMMYPRLKLARNLLKEDGVIFISIDDNEKDNLKLMCDEIFGSDIGFVGCFIWEKKKKPSFLNSNMGTKTEYVLVYSKNRKKLGMLQAGVTEKGKKFPLNNAGNSYSTIKFPPETIKFMMNDGIVKKMDMSDGNIKCILEEDVIINNSTNKNELEISGEWRYSQSKIDELLSKGEEFIISKIPFRINHIKSGGEPKKIHNYLSRESYGVGTNEDASKELNEIFAFNSFDYAKPTSLVELLIETNVKEGDIILDFFSGSGTTGHAVNNINYRLGKKLKYIMVQLPEKITGESNYDAYNFCQLLDLEPIIPSIAQERIKISNDKLLTGGNNIFDKGYRVFKLSESIMNQNYYTSNELSQQLLLNMDSNFKTGVTNIDIITNIILDLGLTLDLPITKINDYEIYSIDHDYLIINLDKELNSGFIDLCIEMDPGKVVVLEDSLKSDADLANLREEFKNELPRTSLIIL